MSKVKINISYNIHGHSDHVRERLGEGRTWKNFTWASCCITLNLGSRRVKRSPFFGGEAAPHMILETVLAMFLLASGLGFGPSWDTVAWMQLSGTELVVESERLSDQADRRLRKADNLFCSCGLSPHGDRSSSLCCVCCHRVYASSFHVCRVQCARVVTAAPRGNSSRKAPLR